MNYIERLFGISPDAGSGLTEVVITVALFAILGLAFSLKTHFNRRSGLGDPRTSPLTKAASRQHFSTGNRATRPEGYLGTLIFDLCGSEEEWEFLS